MINLGLVNFKGFELILNKKAFEFNFKRFIIGK